MTYSATVTCAECTKEFEARSPKAKYCPGGKCRKAASRRPSKQGAATAKTPDPTGHVLGGLLGQVVADLSKLGVLETIPGKAALALAYRIESPMESGAAAASMTKELSRLVEDAKALTPKQHDTIDTIGDSVEAKLRLVK